MNQNVNVQSVKIKGMALSIQNIISKYHESQDMNPFKVSSFNQSLLYSNPLNQVSLFPIIFFCTHFLLNPF